MIRKSLILLWMLFPVGVATYHFNEGPKQLARERAHDQLLEIRKLSAAEEPNWKEIIFLYHQLRAELPPDEDPLIFYQIQLAICEARLEMLDLATAIETYLQHKLKHTPEYAEREIHVRSAPGGGVLIQVDAQFYEAVSDVEDDPIRQFLMATIQEWQESQGH